MFYVNNLRLNSFPEVLRLILSLFAAIFPLSENSEM